MQIVLSPDVIGAEIRDVDLAQPLSDADFRQIEAAFNRHAVICFPGQRWSEPQMIAFARRFGEVEKIFLTHYAHPQYPEIMYVSNIQENGRDIGHADAGRVWHTDMSYTARPPHDHRAPPCSTRWRSRWTQWIAARCWAIRCFPVPPMPTMPCRKPCKNA